MTDRLGYRKIFGLIVPSPNTTMQPEFDAMRSDGVTNQTGRFDITDPDRIPEAILETAERLRSCRPDALIHGYTMEQRPWTPEQHADFNSQLRQRAGVPVTLASEAGPAALRAVGAKRIGLVTPFKPQGAENAKLFFEDRDFTVASVEAMNFESALHIPQAPEEVIFEAFRKVDGDDVDALIQVGGALSASSLNEKLEADRGKPVITVNAATYWQALCDNGIDDKVQGFGRLLAEF